MGDSSFGRLIGVVTSPARTFELLRDNPQWIVALVVLALIGGGVGQFAQSRVDSADMVRTFMERSSRDFTDEQIEEAIARQEGQSPAIGIVFTFLFMVLVPLLGALYFWIGTRLFGGDPSYRQSLATLVHAMVPWWGIKSLLTVPALLARDEISYEEATSGLLPSNLAFLVSDEASLALKGLAASIDLFSIWSLVLMAIGFSIVARVSKLSSGVLTFGLWALVTAVTLIPALLFG